ncbi:NTP-binding protein [Nocardia amamiensis]|uniref:NTP-binding protein n=1 Tax=Nocardia amamiensis TaxID=404578 RepID=A0ABS0CN58_9NOCA|nr:phage/plasmid primase, P4 family [Nocardia amamiensis]MBF6298036.1 NTP-binding protein [Nocardia amamiensis]
MTNSSDSSLAGEEEFPGPSEPMKVARRLYENYQHQDTPTLVAWRGGWMRWRGTHWAEEDAAALRSDIYKVLENAFYDDEEKGEILDWSPNRNKVANVMEAMAAIGHLSGNIDPPSWLDGTRVRSGVIACRNGRLDVRTRDLTGHGPDLFNLVSVPFDFDPDAPKPAAWLEFLNSVWPDDPESVALLQEYTGYVLSGRTDMQKMLLLIGPTRSGKGTYARLLTALVGRGNAAGPTLASLGTNFGLSPLLGKPLAVVADARLGDGNVRTVVERLLSISGEDMLTIDRKFKEPWTGKLPTRFVVLSNELPRFGDASGAIANRFLVLQMTRSFLGKEDRGLDARLTAELPGILSWALDGLDRLVRNGRFTVPSASQDATTLMMDLASPISAFVRDCCVRAASAHVQCSTLYEAWKTWCEDNGHRAGSAPGFSRDLRAAVPELLTTRPRTDESRGRRFERIGLRTDRPDLLNRTLNAEPSGPSGPGQETAGQTMFPDERVSGPEEPSQSGGPLGGPHGEPEKPQVKASGPHGPHGSAFKGLLDSEEGSAQPRTPGARPGHWIGSGEPVATVTSLEPGTPDRRDKVRGYLLARVGKANGDLVPHAAMHQCVSGKTGDRALVPTVLADLLAEGLLISDQVPNKRKGTVGYRMAS